MINEKQAKKYCRDDLSKIENYEQAIADKTQTWDLHHRLELTLDGEFALSHEQLKMHDMYYNRPYYELIFLTPAEHHKLHNKSKTLSEDTRRKIGEAMKGKIPWNKGKHQSDETRRKLSEEQKGKIPWNKGKHDIYSEETRKKMGEARKGRLPWNKGKHLTEENRKKISEALKRR